MKLYQCEGRGKRIFKRNRKLRPYGSKMGRYWCGGCDAHLIPSDPSKKRERQKAKQEIKKEQS